MTPEIQAPRRKNDGRRYALALLGLLLLGGTAAMLLLRVRSKPEERSVAIKIEPPAAIALTKPSGEDRLPPQNDEPVELADEEEGEEPAAPEAARLSRAPRASLAPQEEAPAEQELPSIAPANFFSYGLTEELSRSEASLETSQRRSRTRPAAASRRELKRIASIGRSRNNVSTGLARLGRQQQKAPRPAGNLNSFLSSFFGSASTAGPGKAFFTGTLQPVGRSAGGKTASGDEAKAVTPLAEIPNAQLPVEPPSIPIIKPAEGFFHMSEGETEGNVVEYTVENVSRGDTAVCYTILSHPNVSEDDYDPDACEDPANYFFFSEGNSEWSFEAGKWHGTLKYSDAGWGAKGIKVLMVFANRKGARTQATLEVRE